MPAIVAAPLFWGTIAAGAASAGAQVYAAKRSGASIDRAQQIGADTAMRAGDIEAKAASDALEFQRQQEEQRRREFQLTQDRNLQMYEQERDYGRQRDIEAIAFDRERFGYQQSLDEDRQKRLAPYQRFGAGSIAQLGKPIGKG